MSLGLSLGLGLGPRGSRGGSFNPISLFAGSGKGAWYDPSDLTTMFQSGTRASPGAAVTADGDPVGLILDKSGNNNDWAQATGTLKPIYKTSGGLRWLKYDGLDDYLSVSAASLVSGMAGFIAFDRVTDAQWLLCSITLTDPNKYFGVGMASASDSYGGGGGVGLPSMRVNGASIGITRQNLLTASPANTPVVFTSEALDLSAWTGLFSGGYSTFEFGGRNFGFIIAPGVSAANRTATEQWLAAKAGITF